MYNPNFYSIDINLKFMHKKKDRHPKSLVCLVLCGLNPYFSNLFILVWYKLHYYNNTIINTLSIKIDKNF